MSERQTGPYDSIARRWLALVERRQEHLIELCDTGRWRHYYTHAGFLAEMRKVLGLRDEWAAIAGLALGDEAPGVEIPPEGMRLGGVPPGFAFRTPRRAEPVAGLPATAWPD
ncbi:MAG: TIGR03809 family protein [Xanthobacteraceae bacterium]|jgi:hypothetical protein